MENQKNYEITSSLGIGVNGGIYYQGHVFGENITMFPEEILPVGVVLIEKNYISLRIGDIIRLPGSKDEYGKIHDIDLLGGFIIQKATGEIYSNYMIFENELVMTVASIYQEYEKFSVNYIKGVGYFPDILKLKTQEDIEKVLLFQRYTEENILNPLMLQRVFLSGAIEVETTPRDHSLDPIKETIF